MGGRRPAREGFAGGSKVALTLGLALAFGVGHLGSSSALAEGRGSNSGDVAGPRTDSEGLHYTNKRSFRIPFDIDKDGRSKIKDVQLWSSEDNGEHWKAVSKTTPDRPSFTFRASHDGEYWFAVRIFGLDGQFYPSVNDTVVPGMKVLVDTKPPTLVLEPDGRRGTEAAVRWEVHDDNLNLKSLVVEYRVEGVREWRKVPIKKATLIGSQRWDVGTGDAVNVRATISDKAGNETEAKIVISEGTAGLPERSKDSADDFSPPPSIAQVSDSSGISAGPGFGPVGEDLEEKRPRSNSGRVKNAPLSRSRQRLAQSGSDRDVTGGSGADLQGGSAARSVFDDFPANSGMAVAAAAAGSGQPDAFGSTNAAAPAYSQQASGSSQIETLIVASPRFALQYAVEDAGPNGPATVELWVTRDGGRTWIPRGSDLDRTSPFDVDLGGEGKFGIRLVSRSAFGQGDQPPGPGDAPDKWVIVDSSPPLIQLYPVQVGTGVHAGKVAIAWRAVDPHLTPNSTRILWRPDQPGATWQPIVEGQENTGKFIWAVPPGIPGKFHLRVEATDTVGHLGGAETTDSRPIIVDLSRPKSRIIGLDPNARAGMGNSASQIR